MNCSTGALGLFPVFRLAELPIGYATRSESESSTC